MQNNLDQLPRLRLNFLPTPLQELKRLSAYLSGPRIFIKRDDQTGLGMGGNKTRKLEFLLGEALHLGCDTVITSGAVQSNFCRQTSAAAAAAGLDCHLVLEGQKPEQADGNLLLDCLLGARIYWCDANNSGEKAAQIAAELSQAGRKPRLIPFGGSNATGAMGFVNAMSELKDQLSQLNQKIDHLVLPSSSGGTHAGMTVGVDLFGLDTRVLGIGIDLDGPGDPAYEAGLADLANSVSEKLGLDRKYVPSDFLMNYGYFGDGYGVVGAAEKEAVRLIARLEGILLDPVYTARTLAALIDMIRRGDFTKKESVLFWHTGGLPVLFRYAPELVDMEDRSSGGRDI